ncbi:hypothetical protein PYH37_002710 [Sinorhizobium numidicum]|uniref:DUF3108 domain-containing protein n=1 Tax=Sinorhizobium numidicum TaxID=680248 RepID=A0ABY8D4Q1_9HYPH|nr:hypothetical protein [Sinorhizobium numidicum]WEX77876.1 hypothetical protein PYH37_002710 [Sinorhizobium numidicum]WEX84535.1 hypothetical protein PYH38_003423 [Sinorhizobium numidicum]
MQARIIIAWLLTVLSTADTFAAPRRNSWDPNCSPVFEAYAATRSTYRYSQVFYEVKSDGTLKSHGEARFTETAVYDRNLTSARNKWVVSRRTGWSLWDNFGPKFAGCKLVAESDGTSEFGRRYTATWYGFPYEADAEIWLSRDGKTMAKVLRRYRTKWEFPFPNVLEVMNLDPASAAEPQGVAPPD